MSTLSVPLRNETPAAGPLRTGVALALTVALFYAACTVAWLVAQDAFLGFMNSLFHGLDFTPLLTSTDFSWGGFVEALVVMAIWAFLAGTFFGWVRRQLEP
ncbi:MAG: hypothetical protein HOQ10_07555 [Frateuria sp.]|nr:hypothetical protein [Frateuria sp.]